jgi:hypothetical protein
MLNVGDVLKPDMANGVSENVSWFWNFVLWGFIIF